MLVNSFESKILRRTVRKDDSDNIIYQTEPFYTYPGSTPTPYFDVKSFYDIGYIKFTASINTIMSGGRDVTIALCNESDEIISSKKFHNSGTNLYNLYFTFFGKSNVNKLLYFKMTGEYTYFEGDISLYNPQYIIY